MDDEDLELEKKQKSNKKLRYKKRIYEDAMDDDQLIDHFKNDHGIGERYDE
jgi:hypothetical protein